MPPHQRSRFEQKPPESHGYQRAIGWALLLAAAPMLWWAADSQRPAGTESNQLVLWHSAAETFAVIVAMLVFVTGYRSILSARNAAMVLLGISYLAVGLLDFLHMMSYAGMPAAIELDTPHRSAYFWLAARLTAAGALLVYAVLPSGPPVTTARKRVGLACALGLVGAYTYIGLLLPNIVPAPIAPDLGLMPLTIGLEWLVVAINLATVAALWHRRLDHRPERVMDLTFAAALSAVAALFFSIRNATDQDGANLLSHLYRIAAYLYLFNATFNQALKRPLERMQLQQLRERLAFSAAPDGVLWVNQEGRILMANPAIEQLTGYSPNQLVGENLAIFLPPHLRARHGQLMRSHFLAPGPYAMGKLDVKLLRQNGQLVPVDISLGHLDDNGTRHSIAYIRDLRERKTFEESLRHKATHDQLTGLPNRWLFRLQLDQALVLATRAHQRLAVLFLDLDYFKTVNDSFGHATGDALLIQVGARMRSVLRESDTLARLGGDEFAILLHDLAAVDEAVSVASKLLMSLQTAYRLHDQDIYSGGSLGLAFYPDDASDSDTLLRYADIAMYQAKQSGRGAYACYSGEMDQRVHEDMKMHTRLKEAIAQQLLQLHYQPKVGVVSGAVVGVEALLRWHDPVLGQVAPQRFIPVAEATGLILPLSDWVLQTACAQIAHWTHAGSAVSVAINVSAQQFRQRDLPQKVRAALAATGAQARWLDIEITESVAMAQPEHAREQINALVALGCSVTLDDFGTGYSSLAYLKALPVSALKIDKSFLDGIPDDADDVAITRAIIALARSLGLTLVAEGVELQAQLDFLRDAGCDAYQGWYFAKAMDAESMTKLLAQKGPAGDYDSRSARVGGCQPANSGK